MNNCLVIFLFTIFIIYCIKTKHIQKGGDNHSNEIDIFSEETSDAQGPGWSNSY